MAEQPKVETTSTPTAPASGTASTTEEVVSTADPAIGSPMAIKAQEEDAKRAQAASDAAAKKSGASDEDAPVARMQLVTSVPNAGMVKGATETVPGGAYMVNGRLVDANGEPIKETKKETAQ